MSANRKKDSANNSVGRRAKETPFGRKAAAVVLSAGLAWALFPAGAVSAHADASGEEPAAEQGQVAGQEQAVAQLEAEAPAEDGAVPAEQGAATAAGEQLDEQAEPSAEEGEPAEGQQLADEQTEPAAEQLDVQLELSNAYITYDGQTVAAPATKVTVPAGSDFTFSVAANSGYDIEDVQVLAGGAQVESGSGAGTYTVSASDVAKSATVEVAAVAQQDEGQAGAEAVALDDLAVVVFAASSDKKDDGAEDAEPSADGMISIDVTASGSFAVDSTITYAITVTNTGKVDLSDVHVVNELSLFDQTVEKLEVGESCEFTASYVVTQFDYDMGSVDGNVFSVSAVDPDGKPVSDSVQADVCALYVEAVADVVYNGADQAIKPVVRGMSADGELLAEGTDYELSYSGDVKNAGKVTVTVTGMGKFAGSVQVSYYITPALLKVTTGSASKVYDGAALVSDSVEIDGLLGGDSVTARATGSQTEVGSSQNTYEISWTGADQNNYRVSLLDESLGTLTVAAAQSSGQNGNGNGGSGSDDAAAGTNNGSGTTRTRARSTGSSSTSGTATSTGTSGSSTSGTASSNSVADALEKGYEAITGDTSGSVTTTERTYDEETPLGQAAPTRTSNWIYFWSVVGLVAAAILATVVWQMRAHIRE